MKANKTTSNFFWFAWRWKLLLKLDFSISDFRRKFIASETYSLVQNNTKPIFSRHMLSWANTLFVRLLSLAYLQQLLWFVGRLSTMGPTTYMLILCTHFVRRIWHKIVLNKNTWPEIVNVFLLIAVSTYSVGKNNKHLTYSVRTFFLCDMRLFFELVNVHHFRDIFPHYLKWLLQPSGILRLPRFSVHRFVFFHFYFYLSLFDC